MRYLITENDTNQETEYKQRYNDQFDRRAQSWEREYFGDDECEEE